MYIISICSTTLSYVLRANAGVVYFGASSHQAGVRDGKMHACVATTTAAAALCDMCIIDVYTETHK